MAPSSSTSSAHWTYAEPKLPFARAVFPRLPHTINFQANNVCNARCVMCNIWRNKPQQAMTLDELSYLLSDRLFSEVRHVGVTGGEPTLRSDLKALYELFPRALPRFEGGSFITHGINSDRAMRVYTAVHREYVGRGLQFSGMISLDGVGAIHDAVRGVSGAFARTTRTIQALSEAGVSVMACCTVVKRNVNHLDPLLEWAIERNVRIRFRVSEFIDRLNNGSCTDEIRAYDAGETRQLVAFFHRLLHEYEQDPVIRRTYRSLLHQITGGPRLIGCPYRGGDAINLDCFGRFAICAPKGIPHDLGGNGVAAVAVVASERANIADKHCQACIHDYHADWLDDIPQSDEGDPSVWSSLYGAIPEPLAMEPASAKGDDSVASILPALRRLLVTGWYGTETVGDVAILRGLLTEYLALNPQIRITVCSLNPEWTRQTVRDLPDEMRSAIEDVVAYGGHHATAAIDRASGMVVAGGPIMDIPDLRLLASLAVRFHTSGRPVIIDGCGLGPLTDPVRRQEATALLSRARTVTLRDRDSQDFARRLCHGIIASTRPDPSITCIRALHTALMTNRGGHAPIVRAFLRAPTTEYPESCSADAAAAWCARLLAMVRDLTPEAGIEFVPMHVLAMGGDDRRFAKRVASAMADGAGFISVVHEPQTPAGVVASMVASCALVCMRYHSVVFARTLRIPFLAVDYTGGGKIPAFLADEGLAGMAIRLGDESALNPDVVRQRLARSCT